VTERLYFGRNVAQQLGVTDSAWAVLCLNVVSARCRTASHSGPPRANGVGADGRATREPSFVLEVVHPARSATTEAAIAAIITEYSVGSIRSQCCAS